jgi:hypothetical protein
LPAGGEDRSTSRAPFDELSEHETFAILRHGGCVRHAVVIVVARLGQQLHVAVDHLQVGVPHVLHDVLDRGVRDHAHRRVRARRLRAALPIRARRQ